jgi:uncharacterized membrane protein YphA (DoxX/SURF4 family)
LLLRAAAGATAVFQGGSYFADPGNLTLRTTVVGVLGISSGTSLIFGFLTPIVSSLIGLGAIGTVLSWFPPPALNPFEATLPTILAAVVATAVVFLGPGALSVDARLFGRREIIIPDSSRSAKS